MDTSEDEEHEPGIPSEIHNQKSIKYLSKRTNFDDPLFHVITDHFYFERYAQKTLRPDFHTLSREFLKDKVIERYYESKDYVKKVLLDAICKVNVSVDVWSSFNGEDRYVCVICHFVREDGYVRYFVIGFEILDKFEYGSIAGKVIEVLDKFGLKGKVGSISFEDGVSKDKCMEYLGKEFEPKVLEMFALDRSYANAVDLCGGEIVDQLSSLVDPIRDLLRWFRCKPEKNKELRRLCKEKGLYGISFCLDFSKGWKMTIDNLRKTYEYREVLSKFYNDSVNHSPLEDSQWDTINAMVDLVSKFEAAAERFFSSTRTVSSHLVIQDCIGIAHNLKIYESDPGLCSVVRNIRSKWLELFPDIPTEYCLATILDPHIKLEGLRQLLLNYYETLGVDYDVDKKVAHCKNVLQQLIDHYVSTQEKPETNTSPSAEEGQNQNESGLSAEFNVMRDVLKKKRKRKRKRGDGNDYLEKKDDFENYSLYEFELDKDFDMMEWWRSKKEILQALYGVAKDVLCVPVTTTIPHREICGGRRVLDEKRSMLPPGLLRVCICKADWDSESAGNQGQRSSNPKPFVTDFEEKLLVFEHLKYPKRCLRLCYFASKTCYSGLCY